MINPFVFGRPATGPSFINRKKEIADFLVLLNSRNNAIISSRRQVGKTSLLFRLKEILSKKQTAVIYLDLFLVKGIEEFLAYFLRETAREVHTPKDKAMAWITSIVKSVRPNFSVDDQGNLSASIDAKQLSTPPEKLLQEILDLPEHIPAKKNGKSGRIVIILDEFQRIYEIGGKDLEAKLRAIMQRHKNINYVFAGSNRTLLNEAFQTHSRPFYEWGILRTLGPLDRSELTAYAASCFLKRNIHISKEILNRICDRCEDVPNYVQMFFFHLWNLTEDGETISGARMDFTFEEIMSGNNQLYENMISNISEMQTRLLKGIASGDDAGKTTSRFIQQNRLHNSANVVACEKALIQKNFLEKEGKSVSIRDPFFRAWLQRLP